MNLGALTVSIESDDFQADEVRVGELRGREALSQLSSFDLEVVHLKEDYSFASASIVSSSVSIVWRDGDVEIHRVRGMVASVRERVDVVSTFRVYRFRIVPRAYRLSLVETSEVFLDMSVPAIIAEKLQRVGLSGASVEMRLAEDYPARPYVLQYKETDLAFVSRLAEHVGIAFHFEDGGKEGDKIVFTDAPSAFHRKVDLRYGTHDAKHQVFDLHVDTKVIPAAYVVNDYDYDNPALDLTSSHDLPDGYGGGVVEHAPNYVLPGDGARFARIRAEGLDCRRVSFQGGSNSPKVGAGAILKIAEVPTQHDSELLVTSVEHIVAQAIGELGSRTASPYQCRFEAVRAAVPFRPERKTPRPVVTGLLVGFVTDYQAKGNYGAVDATGQYTVRLHLDTAPHPKLQSLPIRMVQAHNGSNYGVHMPLRAGTEVMVAFLAGDPDRPVIVGSVPNALTPSPVKEDNRWINKILRTETGIVIEARDLVEPDVKSKQQAPGS